jgi:hypothetical protein
MQDGGPVTPKPNAVKYKVPLTTKKASERLIHLSKKSQRGTRNLYLQLERMPQPGKQVGRRRTMYADGGNIPQIDEESPLDIDAKVSFYNLSPAPTVIAPSPAAVATTATPAAPVDPTTSALFGGASSALEHLYNATDGTNNFDKVVDFLGTMAEAESFKGKDSLTSSASGIFHFQATEAGTTKQA